MLPSVATVEFRGERLTKAQVVQRYVTLHPELLGDDMAAGKIKKALAQEGVTMCVSTVSRRLVMERKALGYMTPRTAAALHGAGSKEVLSATANLADFRARLAKPPAPPPSSNGHAPAEAALAKAAAPDEASIVLRLSRAEAWKLFQLLLPSALGEAKDPGLCSWVQWLATSLAATEL
jgi:hypothetical protein